MRNIISLKKITKTYKLGSVEVPALREVDLEISEGEFVSVMGPSGSGKSTLMNIIGCLDVPTSGYYWLESTEVSQLNDNRLADIRNRKIGFVFQTYNLLPRATALQNVELPLVYAGRNTQRKMAMEALQSVNLADRANHKPSELSGGERQRVAIARALINDPAIILADEPTGNLDSRSGLEIIAILQKLNREGRTILLVTHERDIARHSQKIIHLRDGKASGEEWVQEPLDAQKELAATNPEVEVGL